jgi:hypothetical protein
MLAKESRQETIQCAIGNKKETKYRKDIHFLPISSHFGLLAGNDDDKLDKDMSIFYMDYLTDMLNNISGVKRSIYYQQQFMHEIRLVKMMHLLH